MKKIFLILSILMMATAGFSDSTEDIQAYSIYRRANESYQLQKIEEAKSLYQNLAANYPNSQFTPYALYILSFLETDTLRIISYLFLIEDRYPNFRHYRQAVERLGDVYYVLDNHSQAIEHYKIAKTEKSYYMLGLIYSANGFQEMAIENLTKTLSTTKNYTLAYNAMMVMIKAYFDMKKLPEVYQTLVEAIKLKGYSEDNGMRLLFYTARYYFQRLDVERNFEKSLYAFSLLKELFPFSIEATMANPYLEYLRKNNITKMDKVQWIETVYVKPLGLVYQDETIPLNAELEKKAEDMVMESEGVAANMIKKEVEEYVVRIGEYKDLSVANLIVADIAKSKVKLPVGLYYRNDLYYPEIRGVKDIETAKKYAQTLLSMGYKETKVIEVVKVLQFNK